MSLRSVSDKQIIDRIKIENPWWVSKEIEEFYDEIVTLREMMKHPIFLCFLMKSNI